MQKFFDYFDGRYRESILNKPSAMPPMQSFKIGEVSLSIAKQQ